MVTEAPEVAVPRPFFGGLKMLWASEMSDPRLRNVWGRMNGHSVMNGFYSQHRMVYLACRSASALCVGAAVEAEVV